MENPGPKAVAAALTDAKLWEKVDGGYRIHDYLDHNRKSADIKGIQEEWRTKKATQRARRPPGTFGGQGGGTIWMSPEYVPGDRSRARVRTRYQ